MSMDREPSSTPPEEEQPQGQEKKPASDIDMEALRAQLEEANREKSQFKAMAQRAQADLANYRKRVEDERDELARSLGGRLVLKLLPLLDDLQQALSQAPATDEEVAWLEGVRLVERKFRTFLEAEGVTPIEVQVGTHLDPWEHEALLSVETENHAAGTVMSVIRRGYKQHGRVLRAAQVVVARSKAPEGQDDAPANQGAAS